MTFHSPPHVDTDSNVIVLKWDLFLSLRLILGSLTTYRPMFKIGDDALMYPPSFNKWTLQSSIGFIQKSCICCREAVRNVWCGMTCDWDPCREKRRRVIISLTWFLATVVLAVISPDIGIVIDALGSLAAVFIFVLPGKKIGQFPLCICKLFPYHSAALVSQRPPTSLFVQKQSQFSLKWNSGRDRISTIMYVISWIPWSFAFGNCWKEHCNNKR